jgi:hypothetical protein
MKTVFNIIFGTIVMIAFLQSTTSFAQGRRNNRSCGNQQQQNGYAYQNGNQNGWYNQNGNYQQPHQCQTNNGNQSNYQNQCNQGCGQQCAPNRCNRRHDAHRRRNCNFARIFRIRGHRHW